MGQEEGLSAKLIYAVWTGRFIHACQRWRGGLVKSCGDSRGYTSHIWDEANGFVSQFPWVPLGKEIIRFADECFSRQICWTCCYFLKKKKKVRWCSERQKTTTKNTQQLWTCIKEYMQYWESVDIEENALHVRSGIQWNTKGGWRKPLFGIIIMLKAMQGLDHKEYANFYARTLTT